MKHGGYFNALNYTLGNEDTALELSILPKNTQHILTIAGSGSRVLPLLAKRPKHVTCVDLSKEQLYLTELRLESARALEHKEYLLFWGYPPLQATSESRYRLFQKISLSHRTKKFWIEYFTVNQWGSILYQGRWEKAFITLSRINRVFTGRKGSQLFDITHSNKHMEYLKNKFPYKRWSILVWALGNAAVFNALLYRGNFPVKNVPGSMYDFYIRAFNKIFQHGPARNNLLLQLLFFGEIRFSEGNPIECDPRVFAKAKRGLESAKIRYVHGDLVEAAGKAKAPIGFISFSDVPSYFRGETEKKFLQNIKSGLAPDALIVIRNYLRVPEDTELKGYENLTQAYRRFIDQEKFQMYAIDILRYKA